MKKNRIWGAFVSALLVLGGTSILTSCNNPQKFDEKVEIVESKTPSIKLQNKECDNGLNVDLEIASSLITTFKYPSQDAISMTVELNGYSLTTHENDNGTFIIEFDGIAPNFIGDDIDITIKKAEGEPKLLTFNLVKDYLNELRENGDEKTKVLIDNLLVYANACKTFANNNGSITVDEDTKNAAIKLFGNDTVNSEPSFNNDKLTSKGVVGCTVYFGSKIYLEFDIDEELKNNGNKLRLYIGDKDYGKLNIGINGKVVFDNISPLDFNKPIYAAVQDDDNDVSKTFEYSINKYLSSDFSNESMKVLAKAAYNYGKACNYYVNEGSINQDSNDTLYIGTVENNGYNYYVKTNQGNGITINENVYSEGYDDLPYGVSVANDGKYQINLSEIEEGNITINDTSRDVSLIGHASNRKIIFSDTNNNLSIDNAGWDGVFIYDNVRIDSSAPNFTINANVSIATNKYAFIVNEGSLKISEGNKVIINHTGGEASSAINLAANTSLEIKGRLDIGTISGNINNNNFVNGIYGNSNSSISSTGIINICNVSIGISKVQKIKFEGDSKLNIESSNWGIECEGSKVEWNFGSGKSLFSYKGNNEGYAALDCNTDGDVIYFGPNYCMGVYKYEYSIYRHDASNIFIDFDGKIYNCSSTHTYTTKGVDGGSKNYWTHVDNNYNDASEGTTRFKMTENDGDKETDFWNAFNNGNRSIIGSN